MSGLAELAGPDRRAGGAFTAVVAHEVLSSRRNRLGHALLVVFLGMVAVSAAIGWLTRTTVTSVWRQAVAERLTTAPNPFAAAAPLADARNIAIYVIMIGALLAVVVGATTTLRARRSRTLDLILTRSVGVRTYLAAQITGLSLLLAAILTTAWVSAWLGILWVAGHPLGLASSARLGAFFAAAWLLLTAFAALGMIAGLRARTQTLAVLAPIIAWSVMVFVVPQLGTAALPAALLNPVPSVPTTGGVFAVLHTVLFPLSVTEQFKVLAAALLGTGPTGGSAGAAAAVVAFLVIAIVVLLTSRRDLLREGLHD